MGDRNDNNQYYKMRWVIFWIFLSLFVITTVLTLLSLFGVTLDDVDEKFKQKLYWVYIGELAVAVFALFYSLFGIEKKDHSDIKKGRGNKLMAEEINNKNYSHHNFDKIISELRKEQNEGGLYKAWNKENEDSQIPWEYLFNIGIQRILYAASIIHKGAKSANFWVCHSVNSVQEPSFFRSDQREGNFKFEQMVVYTARGVQFRGRRINLNTTNQNILPVYAKVVKTRSCEIIKLKQNENEFDSLTELALGSTHILGIPAITPKSNDNYQVNHPMSITVDLFLENENRDSELILKRASEVQELLLKLSEFWNRNATK